MSDIVWKIAVESWLLLGQMAPYLLFGFLMAGVLSVCVSPAWVERNLGGRGLGPVFKASLFGVPLPLCSCSVIPVSASIRRHGASRAATAAFLLSTPQTGVDSIAITYALLGPVFAIFRPIAALLTGLLGGFLVQAAGEANLAEETTAIPKADTCTDACCAGPKDRGLTRRILHYGLVTLPRDIGTALLIGILIAGVLAAIVPQDQLHAYIGGGILSVLLLMAAGVPVYVCATASVPLAVGFMHLGASPGAALAFLIAGPATNVATLSTVWKVLGGRTAVLYVVTVAAAAVGCGLALDWLVPTVETAIPQLAEHDHDHAEGGWLAHLAAVALLAVLAYSYRYGTGHGREDAASRQVPGDGSAGSRRVELTILGMSCDHCVETVSRGLWQCPGVRKANVDLKSGRAVVIGDDFDPRQLLAAVIELGYSATIIKENGD